MAGMLHVYGLPPHMVCTGRNSPESETKKLIHLPFNGTDFPADMAAMNSRPASAKLAQEGIVLRLFQSWFVETCLTPNYRNSRIFRVANILCDNFSC